MVAIPLAFSYCYMIAGNLVLFYCYWLLAIWRSFIANDCWQFGNIALLNTRWRYGVHVLLNICWQFGVILMLISNNKVSRLYWTRGSKLCFLTRFSYFSCYFLILEFLQICYLLISLLLSWLHGNPISHPIFVYLWPSKVVRHTCPPMFLAQNAWVSWSKMLEETW
jgi:hypothetical protein